MAKKKRVPIVIIDVNLATQLKNDKNTCISIFFQIKVCMQQCHSWIFELIKQVMVLCVFKHHHIILTKSSRHFQSIFTFLQFEQQHQSKVRKLLEVNKEDTSMTRVNFQVIVVMIFQAPTSLPIFSTTTFYRTIQKTVILFLPMLIET